MQRGLRVITLHGAIEKKPILLSQYWKNELFDGSIIISYFSGSNNFFADCMKKNGAKRHAFRSQFLLLHSPLLLPSVFLGGKRKGEKNNQSCGKSHAFLLDQSQKGRTGF